MTAGFILATVLAGGCRLLVIYLNSRVAFSVGADLGSEVYKKILYQSYLFHISRNSSEIISIIESKIIYVTNILNAVLILFAALVIILVTGITMLLINPSVTLLMLLAIIFFYAVIVLLTRKTLENDGAEINRQSAIVIRALQEGLGGIRDALIDGTQSIFISKFQNSDRRLKIAQARSIFLAAAPRYIIEALGMIVIAVIAYYLASQPNGIVGAIPVLGLLALGAQRLLPIAQHAYGSWAQIQAGNAAISDVLEILSLSDSMNTYLACPNKINLKSEIQLKDVWFKYPARNQWALKGVSINIGKGKKIGLVGESGGGKSTLLDILMTLVSPSIGDILIDGSTIIGPNYRPWQLSIAHVPQFIFLADGTVAENIAFGLDKRDVDMERVRLAAKHAQIYTFIDSLPMGLDTMVGERGIQLSGGQRQRIGIARALYKNTSVLILDEATSALDAETESALMCSIEKFSKDLTLIIVAHRLSTLKNCDNIYVLRGGEIYSEGSYEQVIDTLTILKTKDIKIA